MHLKNAMLLNCSTKKIIFANLIKVYFFKKKFYDYLKLNNILDLTIFGMHIQMDLEIFLFAAVFRHPKAKMKIYKIL